MSMKAFYTANYKTISTKVFLAIAVLLSAFTPLQAQVVLSPGHTAATLASALTGTGVIVLSPVLTCDNTANATFTTGAIDPVGVSAGIVFYTGDVTTIVAPATGVDESSFLTPSLSDADLATLGGGVTNDACVLEFDFKAAGDTVKFNYVFASEEYPEFACSGFNDVFGFLISGGVTAPATTYATPTNIARVPGTNIPVCINSVNSAPVGTAFAIATCNALGPGSPFNMYYVDNSTSTLLVFDGKTTVLTAIAAVSPCDTYHLKLGIADIGDNAFNSGVFIQGGSLASTIPTSITATGTSGLPYCLRGCGPGNFVFAIPDTQTTPVVLHFNILGTAVNGYDYSLIADSVTIPIGDTFALVNINTLPVPPAGPKVVTLQILSEDPCNPGVFTPTSTASLTIIEPTFDIITPDTGICIGQSVVIRAEGDTVYDYTWSPGSTLSSTNTLITIGTPTASVTTYTLTATADSVLGCPPLSKTITISMLPLPGVTVDSHLVKTCLGISVPLNVYATPPPGVSYSYTWSPGLGLSTTSAPSTIVTPTILGDITYTVTVFPTLMPACAASETITVHTVPDNFTLFNDDSAICLGNFVQVSISGSPEFIWKWRPPTGVSDTNIMEPVITPTVNGTYTVTANYAHCPEMMRSFYIEVDTPATQITVFDTICIPMNYTIDVTVPGSTGIGSGYYSYQWAPPTFVSNDTLPNPVITPTISGTYVYTVTVRPNAENCAVEDIINLLVLPNTIDIITPDTAICRGRMVQIRATGHELFSYQWLPTAGIGISNVISPVVIPDTSAIYKVKVSFHSCPDFYDSLLIDVQPNPVVYIGGHKFICEFDTIRIKSSVTPGWYTQYSYAWTPSTILNVADEPNVIVRGIDTSGLVLTVKTPAGCTGADSAQIIVLPGNFASITDDMNFCPRDSAVLMPQGAVSYEWMPSIYLDDEKSARPVIKPITTQSYSVIATSNYGCMDTLYFTATVHPAAVIFLEDSARLYAGESYQIEPQTNCTKFSWTPAGGLSGKFISNPVASPEISTKYTVTGVTEHGCRTVDSININIDDGSLVTLPNAFAPGRGPNNEFKIIKRGIATLNYFRIFNRWGNMIFETTNIDEGWNGEYKGVPQPVGVFVYVVQGVSKSGKIFTKQGNVTLLR
jgi:gliding motility-associated-like protein